MSNKKIQHLLEKYWNAECTIQEEREVREHFREQSFDSSPEAALFAYFEDQQQHTLKRPVKVPAKRRLINMRNVLGMAASVAILTIAYFSFLSSPDLSNPNHNVVDDPQEALEITLNALSMVNGSMEKGEASFRQGMQHLDKTFIFKS